MQNILEDYGKEFNGDCIFHPNNDIFFGSNSLFIFKKNKFRCTLCSEQYRNKHEFILHAIHNHLDALDEKVQSFDIFFIFFIYVFLKNKKGTICFADYCDLLGCPSVVSNLITERQSSLCSDRLMQQRRFECFSYLKHCFPSNTKEELEILELFQNIYCNQFYCSHENDIETKWTNTTDVPILPPLFSSLSLNVYCCIIEKRLRFLVVG